MIRKYTNDKLTVTIGQIAELMDDIKRHKGQKCGVGGRNLIVTILLICLIQPKDVIFIVFLLLVSVEQIAHQYFIKIIF